MYSWDQCVRSEQQIAVLSKISGVDDAEFFGILVIHEQAPATPWEIFQKPGFPFCNGNRGAVDAVGGVVSGLESP